MKKYNHKKIEAKAQKKWEEQRLFAATDGGKKPKCYYLVEFPYPSGDGLHIGHVRGYTAMDILARKKRMEGFNVLYPMGWDAFGLPAENYAIKTGQHPSKIVAKNINIYKKQSQRMGWSFDWAREIDTTDPNYYKWTQWIFLQLFKKGLAYKKKMPINWCPECKIGLANEEVVDGKCERCGAVAEMKEKEQWMLKITAYADRLIEDLKGVDYLEKIKTQQINWIGKSEGVEILFPIAHAACAGIYSGEDHRIYSEDSAGRALRINSGRSQTETEKRMYFVNFSVKYNGAIFADGNQDELKRLLSIFKRIFVEKGYEIPKLVVMPEHVHLIIDLPIQANLKEVIKNIKGATARYFFREFPEWQKKLRNHLWTPGYHFEEIVRSEDLKRVTQYILNNPKKAGLSAQDRFLLVDSNDISGASSVARPGIYSGEMARVFTTRLDTIFGATFLVLSPEHELVNKIVTKEQTAAVLKYKNVALKKSLSEKEHVQKEKTGVFTGAYAINPLTQKEIPIWIADYVTMDYGTGAIMAVPAHDERDWAFAKKYNLPIQVVIEPKFVGTTGETAVKEGQNFIKREAVCVIVRNPKNKKYLCVSWKGFYMHGLVTGGIENDEDVVAAAKREVAEETGYKNLKLVRQSDLKINVLFYHRVKQQNRWAHFRFVFFDLENEERDVVAENESALHEVVWKSREELEDFFSVYEGKFIINILESDDYIQTEPGVLVNSGQFTGRDSDSVTKDITAAVGGRLATQYHLRDWVFSRQHYWGEPIPMVYCENCGGWVPLSEKQLPLELPHVKKYEPTGTGESPLAAMTSWVNTKCPQCGGPARRETDTMPNWAGSSWYFLRYIDPKNNKVLADAKKLKYWLPVDLYNGGMEHTTLHLLYSRFWHKFLFDIGAVPTSEPYNRRISHGMILAADGQKMSKSRGNVINPDDVVAEHGADTLRLYEMFMGPYDQSVAWDMNGLKGLRRFLERVYNFENWKTKDAGDIISDWHQLVKKVTTDIEARHFNTAISAMMVFSNKIQEFGCSHKLFKQFLIILSVFAPHIAEELWEKEGGKKSLALERWPKFEEKLIQAKAQEIVIQINGKVRDKIFVAADISEEEIKKLVLASDKVQSHLQGQPLKKFIYVKGRLVSLVI